MLSKKYHLQMSASGTSLNDLIVPVQDIFNFMLPRFRLPYLESIYESRIAISFEIHPDMVVTQYTPSTKVSFLRAAAAETCDLIKNV